MAHPKWLYAIFLAVFSICHGQQYSSQCDKERNTDLPFCDSGLSFEVRVQDLITRLTIKEKMELLVHEARGASENVDLDDYNWWNEALKGVAKSPGVNFRPPTETSTVFPQPLNLAASFNKDLFFLMGNTTGNEGRAFFNVGNAGLTYWSPNINIYRDPRWGRGHETPGEDPRLSTEFARYFISGLQGNDTDGFLKTSACCKHFAAHSLENDRFTFDAVVNDQDMADTYLPVFKSCVQESQVSCVMCAYSAINGIPACADKGLLTGLIRDEWGFDGYIVSDCGAVEFVQTTHNYTSSPSETCKAVLEAGMDIECYAYNEEAYFWRYLETAFDDGSVTEDMFDTALRNGFKVLMRLGYFEKNATRPYTDLLPESIDTISSRQLALDAARQSIVLLKNAPAGGRTEPTLPIRDPKRQANMALIGPHLNASTVFLANYHGVPHHISTPLEVIGERYPDIQFEFGCDLTSFENPRLEEAAALARTSSDVVLFIGISAGDFGDAGGIELEEVDRVNLTLPGLQNELIRAVIDASADPIILFLVSGGAVDLSEWKDHPKVGAIIWAGYLGQSGGEAIADVLFGAYNPSGRLPQTFYANEYVSQVDNGDMNMRPVNGSPGRTYRFFTGTPVYPFGYGLSYTTFTYSIPFNGIMELAPHQEECALTVSVTLRNAGSEAGDHSVLWFLAPPNAGQDGRPIKSLHDFAKITNLGSNESRQVSLCLNMKDFQLANEEGEFQVVPGQWRLFVGDLQRTILVPGL